MELKVVQHGNNEDEGNALRWNAPVVAAHLRVGPLGLDLVGHLLCAAQQVVSVPALQETTRRYP